MGNYNVDERQRLVSEEAAYWYFLCVDDRSMLRSDRREFLEWMRRSPENIAELFKIAQLDGKLRRLNVAMRSLGLTKSNVVELTTSGSPYGLHREIEALNEKEDKGSGLRLTELPKEFNEHKTRARHTWSTKAIHSLTKWLVVQSASILIEDRERYQEQWLADLQDQETRLEKLEFASGVLRASRLLNSRQTSSSSECDVRDGHLCTETRGFSPGLRRRAVIGAAMLSSIAALLAVRSTLITNNITDAHQGRPLGKDISANGSIAAGSDVRIQGENTSKRDSHDASLVVSDYLQTAPYSCRKQTAMISALSEDDAIDIGRTPQLFPLEMYPPREVAEYLGEDVYSTIQSKIETAHEASQGALLLLIQNSVSETMGVKGDPKPEQLANFSKSKAEWLEATGDLCSYFDTLRQKH